MMKCFLKQHKNNPLPTFCPAHTWNKPACLKQKSQAVRQGRGGPEDLHPVCHLTGLPAAGTQPPKSRERHFRRCSPTYNAIRTSRWRNHRGTGSPGPAVNFHTHFPQVFLCRLVWKGAPSFLLQLHRAISMSSQLPAHDELQAAASSLLTLMWF